MKPPIHKEPEFWMLLAGLLLSILCFIGAYVTRPQPNPQQSGVISQM